MPAYLASIVAGAFRMEALFEKGAGTIYPDFYTPLEWECFLILIYARAKDQDKAMPERPAQKTGGKTRADFQAELEARMRRG
jgi:hypothetical protein